MKKFILGSAMGMLVGAGLMMPPASKELRRDMKHKMNAMKRIMKM